MSRPEKNYNLMEDIEWKIKNNKLYEQALTHTSYAHEKGLNNFHNERLEFLGDAVLELIISDYLYYTYPDTPEGKLTKLRADLVCEASLARLAFELNLGSHIRLGKGEMVGGGFPRPSLLADAVEALIGALYLEHGLEECRNYVIEIYQPVFHDLQEGVLCRDFKTLLQEFSQARFSVTPVYRIVAESGPDHDKEFEAEVLLAKKAIGRGRGRSKKEAEQSSAKDAWSKLTP